jgi:uncharacterized protein YndB with AHSA1/START domain
MFWIVRTLIVGGLVCLLVLGLGYLLPAERTTTKTSLIDASPDRVYEIVTDVAKQTEWRSDLRHLKFDGDDDGGPFRRWTEEHETGLVVHVRETAKKPLTQYDIEFETTNGIRGSVAGTFEPSNEQRTKLTVVEKVIVDNPLRRVVCYIALNLDTLMDEYLGDLNRYASKEIKKEEPL